MVARRKKNALAVKAGERDAIMIIDVESGKEQKLQFDRMASPPRLGRLMESILRSRE